MCSLLHDLAALHNKNAVGTLNGGKTVCYNKGGAPLHHFGKGTLNLQLHTGIDR